MSPALIALSFVLLGRSFYILYVQKRGTRPVEILTWLSATLVVCFWTWKLAVPPTEDGSSAPVKAVSATVANFHRVTLHVKDMCKQLNIT